MGVAALVLGIVAIVMAFIPFVCWAGMALGIAALIFGIVATVRASKEGEKKGMSITGLVLGAVSVVIALIMGVASAIGLYTFRNAFHMSSGNGRDMGEAIEQEIQEGVRDALEDMGIDPDDPNPTEGADADQGSLIQE